MVRGQACPSWEILAINRLVRVLGSSSKTLGAAGRPASSDYRRTYNIM